MELDEPVSIELALDAVPFDFGTVHAMWAGWKARLKGEKAGKPASIPPRPDLVLQGDRVVVNREGLPPARAKVDEVEASTDSMLRSKAKSFLKAVDDRERLLDSLAALLTQRHLAALKSAGTPLTALSWAELVPAYAKEAELEAALVQSFLPQLIANKTVKAPRGTVTLADVFASK